MEESIKEYCNKHKYNYILIDNKSLTKIYNLLIKNEFEEPESNMEMLYFGLYYRIHKDDENMKKYWLMAIEKGDDNSMYNLGTYYHIVKKDNENTKKYLLMAIEKENHRAMYKLGVYYQKQKDEENMKKYWLMAIEKGYHAAMNRLGLYYKKEKKDYDNMQKYYLMAIEKGNKTAMFNLGFYYQTVKKDFKNMKKYYKMAIETGHNDTIKHMINYYIRYDDDCNELISIVITAEKYKEFQKTLELMLRAGKPYNEQTIQYIIEHGHHFTDDCHFLLKQHYNLLKQKIDLMELHFKYTDTGLGMKEAQEDFIKQIMNNE